MKLYSKQVLVFILSFTIAAPSTLFAQQQDTSAYDYSNREANHARAMAPAQTNFLPPSSPLQKFLNDPSVKIVGTVALAVGYVFSFAIASSVIDNTHDRGMSRRLGSMRDVFGELTELVILNDDQRLSQYIDQRYRFGVRPPSNGHVRELNPHNIDVLLTDQGLISDLFDELDQHVEYRPQTNDFEILETNSPRRAAPVRVPVSVPVLEGVGVDDAAGMLRESPVDVVEIPAVAKKTGKIITPQRLAAVIQCLQAEQSSKIFLNLGVIDDLILKSNRYLVAAAIETYGLEILQSPRELGAQLSVLKDIRGIENQLEKLQAPEVKTFMLSLPRGRSPLEIAVVKGANPRFDEGNVAQKLEYDKLRKSYHRYVQGVTLKKMAVGSALFALAGYALYQWTKDHDVKVTASEKYNLTPADVYAMYETDPEQLGILFADDQQLEKNAAIFADNLKRTDRELRYYDQMMASLEATQKKN
jgi:hypothetical protein